MKNNALVPARVLKTIGMHPRYKGYAYIQCILADIMEHPENLYSLRTHVYPRVIQQFGCTQAGIERNIRFAVQRTFDNGDEEVLKRLFGEKKNWPPTNTELIAVLSQSMLMDNEGIYQNYGGEKNAAVIE